MLDGTENVQDVKTSEQTTETSEKEPETFTKESEAKAVSDALSAAGRDDKTLKAREDAVKTVLSRAEKIQSDIKKADSERAERKYQADLSKAGEDPIARSKVELDRSLRTAKDELAEKEAELSKSKEELTNARKVAAESTKERNAREIASKYEVDFETLKLMDVSKEVMETWAKKVSGKETSTLKVDSIKTIKGKGNKSLESLLKQDIPTNFKELKEYEQALSIARKNTT